MMMVFPHKPIESPSVVLIGVVAFLEALLKRILLAYPIFINITPAVCLKELGFVMPFKDTPSTSCQIPLPLLFFPSSLLFLLPLPKFGS